MGAKVWPLGTSLRSARRGQTLARGLTVIALVAVACSALISPGWAAVGGVPHAPVLQIGLVALLLAALGRLGKGNDATRRGARDTERDKEDERTRLIEQNAELRRQIDESQRRLVEINDLVLRRVGVELHDGPAQLISFALLRLDGLQPQGALLSQHTSSCDLERIRGALQDALAEIRCMAAGLMLPELTRVPPADVLQLAVRSHERRTGTSVACEVESLPEQLSAAVKSCLYRFAQEALNNAYRHAGGRGQAVRARCWRDLIEVEVTDAGPGFEPGDERVGGRLGLQGMRERVTSLGGTLEIESRPGLGTRLTTRFTLGGNGGAQG
jgi:signal transduction histidine kinase